MSRKHLKSLTGQQQLLADNEGGQIPEIHAYAKKELIHPHQPGHTTW